MTFFYDLNKRLAGITKPTTLNESAQPVAEKIEPPIKTNPAEKGKHSGQTIDQLKSKMSSVKKQMAGYKERGEKVPDKLRGDFSELTFAIRAKQAHGGKWGSIKENDMEEGNRFTYNLKKAREAGKTEADLDGDGDLEKIREGSKPDFLDIDGDGNKKESFKKAVADKKKSKGENVNEQGMAEGWDDMLKDVEKRREMKPGEKKQGHKGEIEKTATGIRHTRRYDAKTGETDSDDEKAASGEKRGPGRPEKKNKKPERVTGKAYKHKGGRKSMEEDDDMLKVAYEPGERGEFDREGDMAKEQLHTISQAAEELKSILKDEENLPEWVQSKITKAMDYVDTARDYMLAQHDDQMDERKLSGAEMAKREKYVKSMKKSKGDFEKRYGDRGEEVMYATATKMAKKGKEEESVEETTTSGSVAPSTAAPKGKKGVFGKGIYDSVNREVEKLIAESMSVNASMTSGSEHGGPSKTLTVTATDEDADKLAALLKMAGVGSGDSGCDCGTVPCSCNEPMDEAYGDTDASENKPDWPTEKEGSDDPFQYSDGANKPKVTGQTTVPVTGVQPAQSPVMYEDEELARMMEMAGVQQDELKPWERTMKEEESVEEAEYQAQPKKSEIPAVMRKDKLNLRDLEKERTASPTTPEGLKDLQQRLGIAPKKPGAMEESLMQELAKFKG